MAMAAPRSVARRVVHGVGWEAGAVVEDSVVRMMVLNSGELGKLYLDPPWRGWGIGDRLVELAKKRCPAELALWTFQINSPAQRFYEQHGFVAVERTDGRSNEEHEPDIRFIWRPENRTRTRPVMPRVAGVGNWVTAIFRTTNF